MKFFTKDLYERSQSDEDAVASAAEDEWEAALQRYEEHVQAIAPTLPSHLRAFTELLLHDAVVQSIAREGDRLLMILRKDIPPRDLVILEYELDNEPILERFAQHPGDWSGQTAFNFDEFDLIREADHLLYSQEIVFSNGWLLRLCFRDVQVTLAEPLYLAPHPGPALIVARFVAPSAQ